jgi:hypothetical protein
MRRKEDSLTVAMDPMAALRELQEIDLPEASPPLPSGSTVASTPASTSDNTSDSIITHTSKPAKTLKRSHTRTGSTVQPHDNTSDSIVASSHNNSGDYTNDPIKNGEWQVVQRPLSTSYRKGPFTTSSVRVPTEVWDRLKVVKNFLGVDQQDILADALADYFDKVRRGEIVPSK